MNIWYSHSLSKMEQTPVAGRQTEGGDRQNRAALKQYTVHEYMYMYIIQAYSIYIYLYMRREGKARYFDREGGDNKKRCV